ncbi:response regulator [Candidatus Latescibacterota bacterium]
MKTLLTTGDVASHCQVTYQTANNWIKGGKLKAFRTPGRHQRIQVGDFQAFLQDHAMPLYGVEEERLPRILVVDDDPAIVKLIVRFLGQTGEYEYEAAGDGFEAGIEVLRFRPDLVLLDLMMPHIDGFKVCERIKSTPETRHIKVLVMTGYGSGANIQSALDRGADLCLTKPFQIAELKTRIDELCREVGTPIWGGSLTA